MQQLGARFGMLRSALQQFPVSASSGTRAPKRRGKTLPVGRGYFLRICEKGAPLLCPRASKFVPDMERVKKIFSGMQKAALFSQRRPFHFVVERGPPLSFTKREARSSPDVSVHLGAGGN
ncbi:MAG: hypothetical protein MR021_06405, partial [Clostridiales bacterium]|nr:hypothetical protein [Clostridiales bacterium]